MKANRFTILVLVLLCFGFTVITKTKVNIASNSEVIISGKSNVNSFKCKYNSQLIEDDIVVTSIKSNDTKIVLNNAKIVIKTNGFDCCNRMINKDFKTILKADDYDNIIIELKEIEMNGNCFITKLNIEIAGKNKVYEIPMTFVEKTKNVKGTLRLNIKDFNLKSPKKLFNLIEVNDNVDIDFNLFLQY